MCNIHNYLDDDDDRDDHIDNDDDQHPNHNDQDDSQSSDSSQGAACGDEDMQNEEEISTDSLRSPKTIKEGK